ncbi:MAG: hypothetical protein AB7I33_11905 [Gemmatimonadales bacterium]
MESLPLTEPQRRHLSVFLEVVDEGIGELLQAIEAPPRAAGVLGPETNDLPPGFAHEAAGELAGARRLLRELIGQLGLAPAPRSRRQRVRALLSSMIVNLEDAGSRGLRGYGPVTDGIRRNLDPPLQAIRSRLIRAAEALDRPR